MTQPVEITLIRHGETAWSLSGRHTGRTDLALTIHGEEQSRDLAGWLKGEIFSTVLTSPLQRARQTCALAGFGDHATVEPDLAEWDYGLYEGRTSEDIRRARPGWSTFRDGCPQGEMPEQVAARADRLINRLLPLGGKIALFTHGQFGCSLAARWISLAVTDARHFALDPAALGTLGYGRNHPELRVILLWNAGPANAPPPV